MAPPGNGGRTTPLPGLPRRSVHEISLELLKVIQTSHSTVDLARAAATFFQQESGCEAVGVRLNDGLDFPYFQANGFSGEFITMENSLCSRDAEGRLLSDEAGEALLDCMCGTIIRGKTDPTQPYYTLRGSFWTNSISDLVRTLPSDTPPSDTLPDRARCRCVGEGYESVALIPLAVGSERIGLLQLNDHRPGVFTAEGVALWEESADFLALAVSRLRAEEGNRRTEEHYRNLFESASDMVILLDPSGRVLDVNQAGCEFVGYSRKELLGMNAAQLHAKEAINTFRETLDKIVHNGRAVFMTVVQSKTGDLIPAEISGRSIGSGGVRQVLCILRDLRERVRAEMELKEKQEQLNRFFSLDAGLLSIADQSGHFLMLSAGWEKVLGYSIEELTARPWVDFIHPEDIKATKEAAGRLRDQKEISDFAHRFIAKDGSVHWLERRSVPVGDLIYGTARDITEKKAAEEELRRLNRTLIALNRANAALVRADDEQALLLEMCEIAAASGGYELAWVGLVEPSEGVVLRPVAWAGDGAGYLDTVAFEWPDKESELPAPLAIRTGRTQIMDDVEAVEMNFPRREYLHKLGVRSVISLPLKDRDEVFGILALDSSVPGAFGPDETALLEELASGLSYGISSLRRENERKQAENDRFRAEADLRVSVEQVERGLEGTVQALASALESRDAYTAGHQRRVAELAEAIAVHLGLPDDRVRGIFLAATLHDIGKIQVPAQILSKPGPLTDVEMAIIRTHPEAGYQILKNVEFPWPIATMVLQHHERLDGSGYPDGLRGQEIPLESRILAVADAVEARTSYRPYRPARDEGEMWKELTGRLSGEFDQAVVAACRAVWPELHERQKQVADSG